MDDEPVSATELDQLMQHNGPVLFGVMRHGPRLDDNGEEDLAASWSDRAARPYDTPLCQPEHVVSRAEELRRFKFMRIISSPFRRCVQTAALVAKTLGVASVDIDFGVGESMHEVMRCGWPGDDHELTYMADTETHEILAAQGVVLGQKGGVVPRPGEDAGTRLRGSLSHIYASSGGASVLVITHGHALAALVEDATGETVYENEYSAFAVLERLGAGGAGGFGVGSTKLVASSGYAALSLG